MFPTPTPHTSGYLTYGSKGGAHSRGTADTNTNTDTLQPMIIEEEPSVPAPARNTRASFHITRMITQYALQAITFDVMTHRPSVFTPINMQQPLINDLNLEHYCVTVIHPTTS